MNRRSFLTTTLGATAAAAVSERQSIARIPSSPPEVDLSIICRRWFTGEYTLDDVAKVVDILFTREWADLPTISDKMFRQLITIRPDLCWVRVISPRITFDIYESNEKRCDIANTMSPFPPPFSVPPATLPVNYYLRNGSAPKRLTYAIRNVITELCKHSKSWYEDNPQFHDYAIFVQPSVCFKQEAYLLDMFCYYHVFGSTDEKREDIMLAIKHYDNDVVTKPL